FRSGWWLKKRCQKYCLATGSQVQLDFSVSVKMMRVPLYLSSLSLHTYQLRFSEPGGAVRAAWNQGCWSEVWLITSSVMTLRPRRCASFTKALKSAIRPYDGWID